MGTRRRFVNGTVKEECRTTNAFTRSVKFLVIALFGAILAYLGSVFEIEILGILGMLIGLVCGIIALFSFIGWFFLFVE
jgi:hypothetical protein